MSVIPDSDVVSPNVQSTLPVSNTSVSELAGAEPPVQFWPLPKSFGPVADVVFAIENDAPPVVDTVMDKGLPALSPVIVKVVEPADAVASVNSVIVLAFQFVASAASTVATVSIPVDIYVTDFPLIVMEYVWLVTIPDKEAVQRS